MAIVAVFSIFYFLALNLSAMVAGLLYLVLGVCIVMLLILSILVDTFISKISLPMQPVPEIGSISVA